MNSSIWAKNLFSGLNNPEKRIYDTDDPDEARIIAGQHFSEHKLQVLDKSTPLRAVMDHFSLGSFSLNHLSWQSPVYIDPGHLNDNYLLCIPITGKLSYQFGEHSVELSPGDMAIASGSRNFNFKTSTGYDQYMIHIQKVQIDKVWYALSGLEPSREIIFESHIPNGSLSWRALGPILNAITNYIRGTQHLNQLVHLPDHLLEMLIITLLVNQPHSLMDTPAPHGQGKHRQQLHKAQELLTAHLEIPITLSELSESLAIPVRTLQWLFSKELGMGPIQWLKEQRLLAINEQLLLRENQQTSSPVITDMAMRFNFTHLGEFSKSYRLMFGETPSETLKKGSS